jgi:peptide/histidine transporter 3/4
MSTWFMGDPESGTACTNIGYRPYERNPYSLIYHVIKFALRHKHPLQRSALTYWEDKLPSRIDLGKSKYGGPFTSEEVDNVKMLLQLIAVLISLLGIFFVSFSVNGDMYHQAVSVPNSSVLVDGLSNVLMVGTCFLLFLILFIPRCHKCLPKMLKRIWIGAVFTVASALSMLLIGHITTKHTENEEVSLCVATLNPYLLLIPTILCTGSYMVLTMSLFEFIIAQSPQSMKGMLIGLYYTLRFGLGGLFVLADYHVFKRYYPTNNKVLSCPTAHFIEVIFIGILSLLMYTIVACKYKPRERDDSEVVNVHIFAEEYYAN